METLKARIKDHEGLRLTPYRDTLGNWTIGYGHKLTPYELEKYRKGISQEAADALFEEDFLTAERRARGGIRSFPSLNTARQSVLIEMIFQMGLRKVSQFKDMILALDMRDYVLASEEMKDSRWYKQTPKRCKELCEIMKTGVYT